jgi:membrane-associated protease RseP (regulator of RpoE activity)
VVLAYGVPGAYVDISDVDVMRAPFRSRFRIYSAGILHNITLALFAFGVLALVPWICAPWYSQTSGVVVLHVPTLYDNGSSVPEPSKLQRGDIVKKTDTCSVHDMDSFYSCLRRYKRSYPIELQADDVVTMPLEVQRAIAGADEGQLAFETLRVSMVATWKQFALELEVSQYVPRSPAATQSTLFLYLPFRILVFWTVLGGCSLGLGILNCAAIWTLDGFHIWTTFVSCVAEWMRAEGQQLRLLWSIHAWFVRITTTAFAVLVAFSLLRFISTE